MQRTCEQTRAHLSKCPAVQGPGCAECPQWLKSASARKAREVVCACTHTHAHAHAHAHKVKATQPHLAATKPASLTGVCSAERVVQHHLHNRLNVRRQRCPRGQIHTLLIHPPKRHERALFKEEREREREREREKMCACVCVRACVCVCACACVLRSEQGKDTKQLHFLTDRHRHTNNKSGGFSNLQNVKGLSHVSRRESHKRINALRGRVDPGAGR